VRYEGLDPPEGCVGAALLTLTAEELAALAVADVEADIDLLTTKGFARIRLEIKVER